jgi:hypothetical protein
MKPLLFALCVVFALGGLGAQKTGLLVFRRCLLRRFHVQISHQPEQ